MAGNRSTKTIASTAVEAMVQAKVEWASRPDTIISLIRLLGISRRELARRMDMTSQSMSNRLNHVKSIDPWELVGFALAIGVPIEVLDLSSEDAVRWILDNGSLRNRWYALSPQVAA
jgi:lambda repressor-like predicted transcriptional regulator